MRDIARETADWLTDIIEMREASRRAQEDEEDSARPDEPHRELVSRSGS